MNERSCRVGLVVVGRNEGDRLANCLAHVIGLGGPIVYVDSGSEDGSPDLARKLGVDVVELAADRPYTAGRARNEGFRRLLTTRPDVRYVQFVDGDCELRSDWLARAEATLSERPDVVMVAGRLRERHPEASVYNLLCDMEWNVPAGPTASCGGNCMVRAEAFDRIGGFTPSLIAGEEPELGWRLREAGGKLLRLEHEMAIHDAELQFFRQWWRRQVRAGHAATENADLHGRRDARHYVHDLFSNLVYGAAIPVLSLGFAPLTSGLSLLLWVAYPGLYLRVRRHRVIGGDPPRHAAAYARYAVVGKFAQATGTLLYLWKRRLLRRASTIIEYKHLVPRSPSAETGAADAGHRASAEAASDPRL